MRARGLLRFLFIGGGARIPIAPNRRVRSAVTADVGTLGAIKSI